MKLRSIENLQEIAGKRVFVRADTDVPLLSLAGQIVIADDRRLNSNLETLRFLLKNGARVVLGGQIDRPGGQVDPNKSLKPVFEFYAQSLPGVARASDCVGAEVERQVENLGPGELLILENLRFHKGEVQNDDAFAKDLARLADFYVNEDFANCHRRHASMTGLSKILPSFAGFHLLKEVAVLSGVLTQVGAPLVVIIGGEKIETKLPVIQNFLSRADLIFVGGLPGCQKASLEKLGAKVRFACGDPDLSFSLAKAWANDILRAKTIVWNGPLGDVSRSQFVGTEIVARAVAEATRGGAQSVVGGGDTEAYLKSVGLDREMSFISTGGGAMLDFLSGQTLPALEPLII